MSSTDAEYTRRLQHLTGKRWKQMIPTPSGWNVRRLAKGRVLDVGCGIGRCLDFIRPRGVGVDPNETAIAVCKAGGHEAYTPEEFAATYEPGESDVGFDTLLCSHVLEHLDEPTGVDLIRTYVPYLRDGATVVIMTPQERGQQFDATHVRFMDDAALAELAAQCDLTIDSISSFPLPRAFGRWFVYNETVTVARVNPR
jgi:2-polyprenyl-3-methyl-5-hydroxy-6-metoxy-1,4-benzoquinol methylase